ncbi:acetolactate synthase, small subunit [Anaerosphaera aminiphila DSM 21120]|uniref:Acetolactate synthase small subunit n=1 Tax=Anaerosphaera aminiphila DSM 21120 TaxID=1120995 RepID=A0A1M5R7Y5_9FIRM|nr:acetolactate synthase small subunit [Anaerosphaera aminiphila]SHH22146.1 acetolactate synthase, small subunit [Anaerosphaera aminiphila DSM 21120]
MASFEVISILVENNAGILARISSLFARRGFNIETLTVSATDDPDFSRITLTVIVEKNELHQIVSQTDKLEEVRDIEVLDQRECVFREIVLVKVKTDETNRAEIAEIAKIYKASVVDLSPSSMIIELTGKPVKINAFLKVLEEDYEIVEICRTGVTGMKRI